MELNKDFWNNRYKNKEMGWDIGYASTPLKNYIDQLEDKEIRILIPGCGNAYEAEYLHLKGFKNVFLLDIAPMALQQFSERVPEFPKKNIIQENFFVHQGSYKLILEQTFFCAINPEIRDKYVHKMHQLLIRKGKLVGLLFAEEFENDHPPFGGTKEEYIKLFSPLFRIQKMELANNSIEARKGKELFIQLIR
tara:strand:+ start:2769 stop:3347 length:579 start_codon:yes stop_codon:yes gene_type:complete